MIDYTLQYPCVENRFPRNRHYLNRGDVVAFSSYCYGYERTGIIIMDSPTTMLAAVNLYKDPGYIWVNEELPEDIDLYNVTEEEKLWGQQFFFDYYYLSHREDDQRSPVVAFIEDECPKHFWQESDNGWSFCFDILISLPGFGIIKDRQAFINEVWMEANKGIRDTGLLFNPLRTELYCFLIGVLMIIDKTEDCWLQSHLQLYRKQWEHFSWMYSMVIGRLIGTRVKTFTAMVNNLDNNIRGKYIHLYLPLVESNIAKICKYSNVEKPQKLQESINKMKVTQDRHEQEHDLDELYGILFPSYFKKMMNENLQAASVKEMKKELADKDEQINHWKGTAAKLEEQLNELTASMQTNVEESLSMEEVSSAILAMKIDMAKLVFSNLDFKLRKNMVWRNGRDVLQDKLEEKEEQLTSLDKVEIKEYVAVKQVETMINTVEAGGTGVSKCYNG